MRVYGVVMAGGGGTRFWPLSRVKKPKQLLNLSGKEVMINEAIDRLAGVVAYKDIFVVTNKEQYQKVVTVTDGRIEKGHILSEPASRNTSACIGYAAMEIIKKYGDGVMVITPSDAFIRDNIEFASVLSKAVEVAGETDKLVTIGIKPTFPATGYGYINFEKSDKSYNKVIRFVEKPNADKAKEYYKSGAYLWNSGMFIWKASVILEKFKKYLPEIYKHLQDIGSAMGTSRENKVIAKVYPIMENVSIDYGIMEKSDDIVVVSGDFGWNDVGCWDMLGVLKSTDSLGNTVVGNVLNVDTKNCILYSSGKLIATVGIDNLIVVETDDAIMICPKNKSQDVKKIVEELKAEHKEELL